MASRPAPPSGLLLFGAARGLAALVVMTAAFVAKGQDQPPANAPPPPASAAPAPAAELPGDFIYLPDENGRLVPVPVNATLREYLEMRKGEKSPADKEPDFAFTSVELAGAVEGATANLTATLSIKVNHDEAVRVPLGLKEATLRDHTHEGDGDAFPGGYNRETTGYSWWLQGRGLHKLVLTLSLPVQSQLPSQRLQLTLPDAPVRSLRLRIPVPVDRLTARPPENAVLNVKAADSNAAEIELFGIGSRLDFSWQAAMMQVDLKPVLQATTAIRAELARDTVVINADQHVQALHGNFSELLVRLPPKFKLVSVEGAEYKAHEVDDKGQVRVQLSGPTAGPVNLQWWLESEERQPGEPLVLEGFDVAGAHQQEGEISISAFDGYRVTRREADSQFVYRVPPSNSRDEAPVTRAYRFRAQPFRLALELQKIEPEFTADSQLYLQLSADRADLDAVFQYQVFSGAVQELEIRWPGLEAEGWSVESPRNQELVERLDVDPASETLTLVLSQPATGSFKVALRARRKLSGTAPFDLQLPRPAARGTGVLVVGNGDNVKAELTPTGATVARPLPPNQTLPLEPPPGFDALTQQRFALDSESYAFSATVTAHERAIQSDTVATVRFDGSRLLVSQRIQYDVSFERLSQMRLLVPLPLRGRVDFQTSDGTTLNPDWSGFELGNARQVPLLLPEARLGRIEVTARFIVELPASRPQTPDPLSVTIPLIRSADAEFSSVRFEYIRGDLFEAAIEDEAWEPRFPSEQASIWSTGQPKSEISLQLRPVRSGPAQSLTVRKALVRTAIDLEGLTRSRAQFRIAGNAPSLLLTVPSGVVLEGLWWNDDPVTIDEEFHGSEAGVRIVRLSAPSTSNGEERLLTVDFRSTAASPVGWSGRHDLAAPGFPGGVWVEQTAWQVALPYDQHLFTCPDGYTPQWEWLRDIVFWRRIPRAPYADLDEWIVAVDGPPLRNELSTGNTYVFSDFGPATAMSFTSMSRSLVVLFGASLALAVGFLLLKISATRNVLTLLVTVFVVAVVQLWQRAPVQLLLQPAILGFLLAVGATLIEKSFKRDRGATVLTLSTPSDFVVPSPASSVRPADEGAENGPRSTFRNAPPQPEPVSTSDSGLRT